MDTMYRVRRALVTWICWVGVTTATGMVTFPAETVIVDLTHQILLIFLPATLLVGLGQWLILRSLLRGSGWWVLASAPGAFFVFLYPIYISGGLLAWGGSGSWFWQTFLLVSVATACVGLMVGAPQAGILARHIPGASRWLLINALAWGIGWPLGWIVGSTISIGLDSTLASIVLGGSIWAAVGALTGAGLIWLLNESYQALFTKTPAPKESNEAESGLSTEQIMNL